MDASSGTVVRKVERGKPQEGVQSPGRRTASITAQSTTSVHALTGHRVGHASHSSAASQADSKGSNPSPLQAREGGVAYS